MRDIQSHRLKSESNNGSLFYNPAFGDPMGWTVRALGKEVLGQEPTWLLRLPVYGPPLPTYLSSVTLYVLIHLLKVKISVHGSLKLANETTYNMLGMSPTA